MKKMLSMLLALTMVLCLLVGCGSNSAAPAASEPGKTEPAASEPAPAEKVELTIWTPPVFAVGYLDALNKLVNDYMAENENVKIEVVEINWDGIAEKLESAMMTGSTPDIYIDGTARTAKLPGTDLVVDVSDVINGLDGWNEACTKIGERDGAYYLVPLTQMPPQDLAINVSLAKEYGCYDMLPDDRVSWDWDQFMAFLEAVGEKSIPNGVYPIALYAANQSSDISYYTMMLSAGASILNDDHTASAVNSEAAVAAIAKLKEINDKGLAYPGVASLGDEDCEALFFGGKAVINIDSGSMTLIPVLQSMAAEGTISEIPEVEAYAWPTLNGSKTVIGNWGANCIAIFKNKEDDAKIAAAKEFLKYMLSNKEFSEALWAAAPSYAPARMFGQELHLDDENLAKEAEMNNKIAAYCTSQFGILESFWGEIRQHFYPELQAMFNGSKTPEEVVANFDASINEVINNQ